MSTICKIALTARGEAVVVAIKAFLGERNLDFTLMETEWPSAGEDRCFVLGAKFPSVLSVKQVTPDVTEIHFNSFAKLEELASYLSAATSAKVVVNIYQSTATASYWAYHVHGKRVRSIEAGDSVVFAQTGERLSFEGDEPGLPSEDQDPEYDYIRFDDVAQDWYNREVGVPIEVYQDYESGWLNFVISKKGRRHADSSRPWWRFW